MTRGRVKSGAFGLAVETWRACRDEYELYREAMFNAAEVETNGRMLNRRGMAAGIDAYSLFMGTEARALAYASEELIEFWTRRPRVTFAAYEQQWLASQEAERYAS